MICRQIVASVDEEAAGPSYSVTALAQAVSDQDVDSRVFAVGSRTSQTNLDIFPNDFGCLPVANRICWSNKMVRAIEASAKRGALIHIHGLWLAPNIIPAKIIRRHNVPLVVSPRGMLGKEALAFSPLRKKFVWALWQRKALMEANCFHATSESEAEDIRRAGFQAPIAIIPNGVDIPALPSQKLGNTVLYLGRLHPKKGVDRLLYAWKEIADEFPDWDLRIVGPSERGCREALESLIQTEGIPRVSFEGAIYGRAKTLAYRQAGVFVLPTLNENFGMVVAEALAHGLPVVCTKGAPWEGLEYQQCGRWVDRDHGSIAKGIKEIIFLTASERDAMGARGRAWMESQFSWDKQAAQMKDVYRWCLGRGEKPKCVVDVA